MGDSLQITVAARQKVNINNNNYFAICCAIDHVTMLLRSI